MRPSALFTYSRGDLGVMVPCTHGAIGVGSSICNINRMRMSQTAIAISTGVASRKVRTCIAISSGFGLDCHGSARCASDSRRSETSQAPAQCGTDNHRTVSKRIPPLAISGAATVRRRRCSVRLVLPVRDTAFARSGRRDGSTVEQSETEFVQQRKMDVRDLPAAPLGETGEFLSGRVMSQ